MKIDPMVFLGCWAEFKVKPGVAAEGAAKLRGFVSGVTLGAPGGRVGTCLLVSSDGSSEPYGWDFELFQDDIVGAALTASPAL
jgi:hypothetical protein